MNRTLFTGFSIVAGIFLTTVAGSFHPIAAAVVGIVAFIYIGYVVVPISQGLSLFEQRKLNKYRKTTTRDDRYVTSNDSLGMAISRDGDTISMFVELSPSPLETIAYTDDGTGIPSIPLTLVADTMRQFDIVVDSMNVISFGYVVSDDSPYSRAYRPALRNNMTTWRTLIEVTIRLSTSLPSVNARRDTADGPEMGLVRLVKVATQRLRNRLTDAGWHARVLSKTELENFDNQVYSFIGDGFDHEHRFNMGSATSWSAAYSSPDIRVVPSQLDIPARAFGVVRKIVPKGDRGGTVTTFVCAFGDSEADVTANRKSGLRRLPNVQGDVISHLLPFAPNPLISATVPSVSRNDVRDLDVAIGVGPAYGLGALLGETRIGDNVRRVSLTTSSAKGEVLYMATNHNFIRNLVSRLAATGNKAIIDVRGDEWEMWIRQMNTPLITRRRSEADIVVIESATEVLPRAGIVTIVVTAKVPPTAKYSITQLADGTFRAIHGRLYRDFNWTAEQAEVPWWSTSKK